MSKVSVLVAVYNASAYLRQCLDSLLHQTHDDIQVICVDDCSTDDSLSILYHYSALDKRVEVYHLDSNQGQAHARNIALQHATGEYICMLDSDDWFSADALEKAVSAFDVNTDCVLFDVLMEWGDRTERYEMPEFNTLTGDEAFRLSLTWQIHGLYMVRASIHRQFPYDETCRLYSDDNTTRIHYLVSRNVRKCCGEYHYRQNPQSSTHTVSVRRFDYLRANESMKNQMLSHGVSYDALCVYENHRWLNLIDVYMFYHCHGAQLTGDERRYGLNELCRIWSTIDHSMLNKKTITKFGYRPMSSWLLFRVQEWLYFTLRGILGRNH